MNKIIYPILLALIIPAFVAIAQSDIDAIMDKYKTQDGFKAVNVSPEMLAGNDKSESNETMKLIQSIDKVNILTCRPDRKDPNRHVKFFKEARKVLKSGSYDLVMEVDEDATEIYVFKNKGDKVTVMVLLTKTNDDTTLVKFNGDLDLDAVMKFSKKIGKKNSKAD